MQITETRFMTFWRGADAALKDAGLRPIGVARASALYFAEYGTNLPNNVVELRPTRAGETA